LKGRRDESVLSTGIHDLRHQWSKKYERVAETEVLRAPVDMENPYREIRLAGWTGRSECVTMRRVTWATIDEHGMAVFPVWQSGTYVLRLSAEAYEPRESEVFSIDGSHSRAVSLSVKLKPVMARLALILSSTSRVPEDVLEELEGAAKEITVVRIMLSCRLI
jgi:hypothetical protein